MNKSSIFARNIEKAHQTHWSFNNNFSVDIRYKNYIDKERIHKNAKELFEVQKELFDLCVVSLDTPQFSQSTIEKFQGGDWYYAQGRDEIFKFTLKLRDRNILELYRQFIEMWNLQTLNYPDECFLTITIQKGIDLGETNNFNQEIEFLKYDNVLIDSVSALDFSNEAETQISQFSVSFKTGVRPSVFKN